MPRRSRSKSGSKGNLAVSIIAAAAIIAALVLGFVMIRKNADPYPGIKEINRSELMESGTSMANNTYRVSGRITEKRLLLDNRGALIYVSQGEDIENAGIIPVHVPAGTEYAALQHHEVQTCAHGTRLDHAGK